MKAKRSIRRRGLAWALAGLLAYGLWLVALVPAAVVWDQLSTTGRVPEDVDVRDVRGTLWSGEAGGVILPNGMEVSRVVWRFRARALLGGRLEWALDGQPPNGRLSVHVSPGWRGVRLTRLRGHLDAAATITPVPLVLTGNLILDVSRLDLAAGSVRRAEGTVGWLDAAAGLPEPLPLGHLRATLEATPEGALRLNLSDQGGPLIAEGFAQFSPAGAYRVEGAVGARPDADPRLAPALGMMGSPGGDGRIPINLSGGI